MFTSLLLTASLTGGQPPANYDPPGSLPGVTAVGQPAQLPKVPETPKKDVEPKKEAEPAKEDEKKEDEPKPPTKYFFEKSIAETRLGDILTSRGITVYGWTEMSYNASTASKTNAPVFMIDRANQFLLNQNYLVVEKTLDTSKKEFQLGWRTDFILPGSDYRTTLPRGIWNDQLTSNNGGPQLYGIDPYQFYAQAYLPNLGGEGTTVKLGRFATHCNFELVQAVDTPFVSRSYLFQYNPFTHTGVYATTPLNDTWTVGYGAALGADNFIDPANQLTFLGSLKWAPKDGKTSIILNAVITNPQYNAAEAYNFYNVYEMILTHKFNDKLTYVLDAAYSHMDDAPGIGFTQWYGAANYLIYAHNDTVTSTLRAEVFNDQQGYRTGFAGLYTELTYGVAVKACDGLIIRPSVRYDNNSKTNVWEGNQNLFTATLDVILRW